MYTVRWAVYEFDDDGKKHPPKRWHTKKFEVYPRINNEETVRFEAFLFFRKKCEDPRWDTVELIASDV